MFFSNTCTNIIWQAMWQAGKVHTRAARRCVQVFVSVASLASVKCKDAAFAYWCAYITTHRCSACHGPSLKHCLLHYRGLCWHGPRISATLSPGTFPPLIWNQSTHHWPLGRCQIGEPFVTLYLCQHFGIRPARRRPFPSEEGEARRASELRGLKARGGWGG